MESHKQIWGHFAAFFTIFVWGITFIFTKVLLVPFSPIEIMVYRLLLAVLVLFAVSPPRLAECRPGRWTLRHEWKIMAAGLCGVTLYFLFQNIAQVGGQAVLGRQSAYATPWLTERHGYDPTCAVCCQSAAPG